MKYTEDLEKSDKWIVAITALCALLLFSWLIYDVFFLNLNLEGQVPIGKIYETQNRVKRKFNRSLIWYAAGQDETVYENDWIFTGAQSIAKIRLDSGSEIIIEPDSLIILSRKNGVLQLNLQHGRLLADVKSKDVQINVVRNGETQTITADEDGQVLSVAQLLEGEAIAEDKAEVDYLDLDKDSDGKKDVSLSDLANQRNYVPKPGFSKLDSNNLSYRRLNEHFANLYPGDKARLDVAWEDPYQKFDAYEVQVANDPEFKNIIAKGMVDGDRFEFKHGKSEDLVWRVKGLSSVNGPGEWSENLNALLVINWLDKNQPVQLETKKIWHQIKEEKINRVQADRSYDLDEDENITLAWKKASGAKKYRVEVSDKPDFSDIREQKIVDSESVDLKNIKLGQSYFRVIPENENGVQTAEAATGVLGSLLPAPKNLKTIDKEEYQVLRWKPVGPAQMYKVTYKTDKNAKEESVEYVEGNQFKVPTKTGYLQWNVRAVDPETKKWVSAQSETVDWYDAAKRLASLHKTGDAGFKYPKITKPAPRKTFMSVNGEPLFIVLNWEYAHPAKAFEVEISKKSDMSKVIYRKRVNQYRAVLNQKIDPGVYFMRVRALQDDVTQEAWSEAEVFRVIDRKVDLKSPAK